MICVLRAMVCFAAVVVREHSFGTQGAETGWDIRKGTLAYLWTTALKSNEKLKLGYAAVGRNYKQQAEFRQKWARDSYELELSNIAIKDVNDEWEGCDNASFAL